MREYREEKSCMTCKFGWLGADEPYPCRECVRVPTEWKPIGNKADRKTENSSEIPNNYCDDCLYADTCDSKEFFYACTSKATISKMEQVEPQLTPNYCGTCKHREVPCGDLPCDVCHGYSNYEPKDEPTISKMEQVDKDINVRSKDEPQTDCAWGKHE